MWYISFLPQDHIRSLYYTVTANAELPATLMAMLQLKDILPDSRKVAYL